MPPVSSVLGNCVVDRGGNKASPSAACARGTGRDGLEKIYYACYNHRIPYKVTNIECGKNMNYPTGWSKKLAYSSAPSYAFNTIS